MERPLAFVIFWLICFVLVGFVLMLAVYDIMAIRRAHRMEMDQLDVDIEVAKFEAEKLLAEERMKAVSQDESSD